MRRWSESESSVRCGAGPARPHRGTAQYHSIASLPFARAHGLPLVTATDFPSTRAPTPTSRYIRAKIGCPTASRSHATASHFFASPCWLLKRVSQLCASGAKVGALEVRFSSGGCALTRPPDGRARRSRGGVMRWRNGRGTSRHTPTFGFVVRQQAVDSVGGHAQGDRRHRSTSSVPSGIPLCCIALCPQHRHAALAGESIQKSPLPDSLGHQFHLKHFCARRAHTGARGRARGSRAGTCSQGRSFELAALHRGLCHTGPTRGKLNFALMANRSKWERTVRRRRGG